MKVRNRFPTRSIALGIVAVALAGCGETMSHGPGGMDMSSAPMTTSARAQLTPAAAYEGSGVANFAIDKGQVHADLAVQKLTAAAAYNVHLHQGTCVNSGKVDRELGSFQSDATGAGKLHAEFAGEQTPTGFVDVHTVGGEGPALCGEIH